MQPAAAGPLPAQARAEHRPDLQRHWQFGTSSTNSRTQAKASRAAAKETIKAAITARAQTAVKSSRSSSSRAGTARGRAQQQNKAKRAISKGKQSGTGMSLKGFVSRDTVNAERDCTRMLKANERVQQNKNENQMNAKYVAQEDH